MNTAGLSLDNIPPLRVPMGFFLTAPWFGMLAAAVLLLWPEAFDSRWHPAMLAIVHLLTLGFGAMVMIGAMIQVLPVLSSSAVPAAPLLAPWIRGCLSLGTLGLAGGFLFSRNSLLWLALPLLLLVFLLFLGAAGFALLRAGKGGSSVFCLRLAALSLLVTVLFGIFQLSTYVGLNWVIYSFDRTDDHALLGLLGWGALLIMGVSFQVIPMFHVAPSFPTWLTRLVPVTLALSLIAALLLPSALQPLMLLISVLTITVWAVGALRVLHHRKRKLLDYTVRFWELALGNLLAAALFWGLYKLELNPLGDGGQLYLLLGFGFGIGFMLSVILGMLQKIVPFLMFLHLQRACMSDPKAFMNLPNMKELIPTADSCWQFRLHCTVLILLYLSFVGGEYQQLLLRITALALLISFGWLARTLIRADRLYRNSLPVPAEPSSAP